MFHDGPHLNAILISIYLWAAAHKPLRPEVRDKCIAPTSLAHVYSAPVLGV
jgi:hypothetical protein